jgi:uncharacterized protein
MIAVDTNILVYAHRRDMPRHDAAAAILKGLCQGRVLWGLPWPCVHEFIATVTHPTRFTKPSTLAQVLAQLDLWMNSPSCRMLGETSDHWATLQEIAKSAKVRGAMIHDTRIAAICVCHGVRELLSADRDFEQFCSLKSTNPFV